MIDKYELLELFEAEPKCIDKESGIYKYKKNDEYGFTLNMTIFLYDEFCSLTLEHKNLKTPIFELGFDKIESIKCKDNKIIIQQYDTPKNTVIYFKPNYSLKFENKIE